MSPEFIVPDGPKRQPGVVPSIDQRRWQTCPVCFGKGIVPQGFYNTPGLSGVAAEALLSLVEALASQPVDRYWQALVDIADWENWQTPTWREIARAALGAPSQETGEPEATVPVMALRPEAPDSHEMDDIVVEDVKMFRAEAMSESSWWLACYFANGEQVSFNVSAHCRPRRLSVTVGDMPGEWQDYDARSALSPNQPEGE